MEFDETKQEDPEFLIQYYKSRIQKWKGNPKGKKIVIRYQQAIERLSSEIQSHNINL